MMPKIHKSFLLFVFVLLFTGANIAYSINIGIKAPDLLLTKTNGDSFKISDLNGSPVIISFYTIFGDSSVQNLKFLESISKTEKNIKVIPVAIESKINKVSEFLKKNNISFPCIIDKNKDALDQYKILILPLTIMVDSSGVIKNIYVDFDNTTKEKITKDLSTIQ